MMASDPVSVSIIALQMVSGRMKVGGEAVTMINANERDTGKSKLACECGVISLKLQTT